MFKNQVVVITGAARGIGAATAKLFAEHGAQVVLNDLDAAEVLAVSAEINEAGGDSISVPGSVTEPDFPDHLMRTAVDKYGKINVVVNNAGFLWDGMAHKMSDEQWQAVLAIHVTAPFRMIRAVAPYMRDPAKAEIKEHGSAQESRCIINVSSTSGLHGNVGQINYSTGKMGILGMTKTIAKEWGPLGIRCNAVAFGLVDTRMTQAKERGETVTVNGKEIPTGIPEGQRKSFDMFIPLRRAATPKEAAGGILLMASPLASFVTGHTLEVTGGMGI